MTNNLFLVLNAGSSSIKFKLFDNSNNDYKVIADGMADRVTLEKGSELVINHNNVKTVTSHFFPDHETAIQEIFKALKKHHIIKDLTTIKAVGHRIVHGGSIFREPVLATPAVIVKLKALIPLAPLHNPAGLAVLKVVMKMISAPNILVFDTSFHNTIPELHRLYPVPWKWYQENAVKKYGFHGISYQYIVTMLEKLNDHKPVNAIICHLGNGSSVAVVEKSKSLNTTMGLTPIGGLMMGTRCGTIDPSIHNYIATARNLSLTEITHQLNKKSGLLAISGISSDMRDIEKKAFTEKNHRAQLALNIYAQKVADYVAKYTNNLMTGPLQYLVFTAGIGENSQTMVQNILGRLPILALKLNAHPVKKANHILLTNSASPITAMVMKTNEELMICKITAAFTTQNNNEQ